ncbi:unnamed protein product [Polarella glacialis]|nr:unnamed protein product [Polarella glacialis]
MVGNVYLKNPAWKYAVFVRDPVERFLSVFIDKCLNPRDKYRNPQCEEVSRIGWEEVSWESRLDDQVRAFEAFVAQGLPTPGMSSNDHWTLQSTYITEGCNFALSRINFMGLLTSDRKAVNLQVREMLHSIFGLSVHRAALFAQEHFPESGHASLAAERHSHGASEKALAFFRQRETLASVLRYVGPDYPALGLELPPWVQVMLSNRTGTMSINNT